MPCAVKRPSTASPKTTVWPSVVLRRALGAAGLVGDAATLVEHRPGEAQHPLERHDVFLGKFLRRDAGPHPHLNLARADRGLRLRRGRMQAGQVRARCVTQRDVDGEDELLAAVGSLDDQVVVVDTGAQESKRSHGPTIGARHAGSW